MPKETCAVCGNSPLRTVRGTYETQFKDRYGNIQDLLVPDMAWQECDNCGEAFLDEAATQMIETARSHAMNLLAPVEIQALRLFHNKSQREMSRLLAIGEKTYCRWESGSFLQSAAFDRYLRLLIQVPDNIHVLEQFETGQLCAAAPNAERQDVFVHLPDVGELQDAANAFTSLLEMGELYTAAA